MFTCNMDVKQKKNKKTKKKKKKKNTHKATTALYRFIIVNDHDWSAFNDSDIHNDENKLGH